MKKICFMILLLISFINLTFAANNCGSNYHDVDKAPSSNSNIKRYTIDELRKITFSDLTPPPEIKKNNNKVGVEKGSVSKDRVNQGMWFKIKRLWQSSLKRAKQLIN